MIRKRNALIVLCAVTHFLVDAASVSFYFQLYRQRTFEDPMTLFFLYNIMAFATQVPLGDLADRIGKPIATAVFGSLLVAGASLFAATAALPGLIVLCLGNAMFHVGGGIITLKLSGGQATIPGIYVAPGTLGVAVGTALGSAELHPAGILASLLVLAGIAFLCIKPPIEEVQTNVRAHNVGARSVIECPPGFAIILLLCGVVFFRSLVGFLVSQSAKELLLPIFAIPPAVFLGKILGGILADRFGWHRFTLMMIVLSSAFFFCMPSVPWSVVPGSFLFTMSMPVTLAAVSNLLPNRPGLAFGMTALAILLGALPSLAIPNDRVSVFFLILATAALFHLALSMYNERKHPISLKEESDDEQFS